MKFLGMLLDENMTWRNHIASIESKDSKNLGILYKARTYLNLNSTKQLYFSFIHSYLSYGNIYSASTNKSNLNTLHRQQKHASRIIYLKDKYIHANPLLTKLNALNLYQLHVYQVLLFMHKVKNNSIPNVFINSHKYNTKKCEYINHFINHFFKTKCSQIYITFRGPHLWNYLVPNQMQSLPYSKQDKYLLTLKKKNNFFKKVLTKEKKRKEFIIKHIL